MGICIEDLTVLREICKDSPANRVTNMDTCRVNGSSVPENDIALVSHELNRRDVSNNMLQSIAKSISRGPIRLVLMRLKHDAVTTWVDGEAS